MITNRSTTKTHEELILKKGSLCSKLEAGNPFFSNQGIYFTGDGNAMSTEDESCTVDSVADGPHLGERIFKNDLELSLIRQKRLPHNIDLRFNVALDYKRVGDLGRAIVEFERILGDDPKHLPSLSKLAECYSAEGRMDEAIELYESNYDLFKKDAGYLTSGAILYLKAKKIDSAKDVLEKANKIDDSNPHILNNLGVVSISKGNFSGAVSFLRKALKINIDDSNIYNNLGVAYVAMKNIKKAIHSFKIAYELNKKAKDVVYNLSNALIENGEYERSLPILEDYLTDVPGDLGQRQKLSFCFFKVGLYNKSLKEHYKSMQYIEKDDLKSKSIVFNNMAIVYERMGEHQKALKIYNDIFKQDSDPEDTIVFNLIELFFNHNQDKQAKDIIEHALIRKPGNAILLTYYADYLWRISKYHKAVTYYNKALKADESFVGAYLGLSTYALDVEGNVDEAIRLLEKGIVVAPDNIAIKNNYIYALVMRGDLERAKKLIENIDISKSVHLNATMGYLLIREGDIKRGREYYNKAIELAHNNRDLYALVNQKKQLELSRYFAGRGNNNQALQRINKGLKFKSRHKYFHRSLENLKADIMAKSIH